MNFLPKTAAVGFLLSLGLLTTAGCGEKFLEEAPRDQLTTQNFYRNETDAILATNAVYSQLSRKGQYNYSLWGIGDIMSDNSNTGGGGGGDGAEEIQLDQFNIPSSNPMTSALWAGCYVGIGTANLVIQKVPGITNMSPAIRTRCVGEAQFLRAKYYFDLVRCFGDVPLLTAPPASPADAAIPRTPAAKVYEQIISDLTAASGSLLGSYSGSDLGRATKWAAMGLLAKVQLTLGNKAEAARLAQLIIATGPHSLWANYGDNFKLENENGKESLFEVQFVYDPSQSYDFNHLGFAGNEFFAPRGQGLAPQGGYGFNIPEPNFVDGYEAGDRRQAVTIFKPGDPYPAGSTYPSQPAKLDGSPNGYNVRKWLVPKTVTNVWDSPLNFPVLRLAEIYLIAAEGLGATTDGFKYLNVVRRRAFGEDMLSTSPQPHDLNSSNTGDFSAAVLRERRYELAFEDDRWFDLKRTGKLLTNAHLISKGIKPFNIVLPIPQSERDANPNLTQNDGY
ncbi:RagB/SusD family nutrient uptake outer membrane protein [Microvirga sp. STS02]|uniref:RagB/SusD family nutrient uptake outer membrane protein n=1 Tax=Hymenobacter negativus TaxID=2795026 RepID=UPI0018DE0444|nr:MULTISPECIES: RagB/SusD family nutrient uptake outer membrane protein [Bacteria]MBH8570786.1 RagB/SusD family nutrient uptake outer membrane protein [Hymenobacter negativus]MBR7210523.1 RagB/SusD family nutrient uptake outer membrane protein [Microvirga sp. STS02]